MNSPDNEKWKEAVREECNNIQQYKVFQPLPRSSISRDKKVSSSTWNMKKKSNDTHRARVVARGYEQIDGIYHDG